MQEINWKPKAVKQLFKLKNKSVQRKIKNDVNSLVDFPTVKNVMKLTNHRYSYRLRSGNYRVFFEHDGTIEIIDIEEVRKRDERTY